MRDWTKNKTINEYRTLTLQPNHSKKSQMAKTWSITSASLIFAGISNLEPIREDQAHSPKKAQRISCFQLDHLQLPYLHSWIQDTPEAQLKG